MTSNIFVSDFETTNYDNEQQSTCVWCYGLVELFDSDDNIKIGLSITDFFLSIFNIVKNRKTDITVYFHNLKFDGSFIIDFLLNNNFTHAHTTENEKIILKREKEMFNNQFLTCITAMGQWYFIKIKYRGYIISICDSLKLLPFSVDMLSKNFGDEVTKGIIDYTIHTKENQPITLEETDYIKRDLLIPKHALENMYNNGHDKLTIGSCCMNEYKNLISSNEIEEMKTYDFDELYPNLLEIENDDFGNCDKFIRKSYKGGWCYVNPKYKGKIVNNGLVIDVNSLYPSVMWGKSENYYPVGVPRFFRCENNTLPRFIEQNNMYYFVRIKTRFEIKKGYLPFIQIKDSWLYNSNEMLTTSNFYSNKTKKYYKTIKINDTIYDSRVELILTCTDFELFLKHYNVEDFQMIDGFAFYTKKGIFDTYIEKYKDMKINATNKVDRTIAKLFQNNLYGKFGTNDDSSFKIPYLNEDKIVKYKIIEEHNKKPIYIPIASAITSYARKFTITSAQANYEKFVYADTDSLHLTNFSHEEIEMVFNHYEKHGNLDECKCNELKNVNLHKSNYLCWKIENCFDSAKFVRQKTYIEKYKDEINIKCAGMNKQAKEILITSMLGTAKEYNECDEEEKNFLYDKNKNKIIRTLDDFKNGLIVPKKLRTKTIKGGVILCNTNFEIRKPRNEK